SGLCGIFLSLNPGMMFSVFCHKYPASSLHLCSKKFLNFFTFSQNPCSAYNFAALMFFCPKK
ncbi:hypothetical protein ACLAEG_005618, partial [Escherichia coli]